LIHLLDLVSYANAVKKGALSNLTTFSLHPSFTDWKSLLLPAFQPFVTHKV